MLEKYGITQEQADKLATGASDKFLITHNNIYQFLFSNGQGCATLKRVNAYNGQFKGLCKRGVHIIADAATVNKTVGYNLVWEA